MQCKESKIMILVNAMDYDNQAMYCNFSCRICRHNVITQNKQLCPRLLNEYFIPSGNLSSVLLVAILTEEGIPVVLDWKYSWEGTECDE